MSGKKKSKNKLDPLQKRALMCEAIGHFWNSLVEDADDSEVMRTKMNNLARIQKKSVAFLLKKKQKIETDVRVLTQKEFKKMKKEGEEIETPEDDGEAAEEKEE